MWVLCGIACIFQSLSQDSVHFQIIPKIHPLAIINIFRPTAQCSLELKLRDKWGIDFTYGYQYSYRMATDTITIGHPKGQTIKLDFKHYFSSRWFNNIGYHNVKHYVGLGFWYVEESGNESFYEDDFGFHVKNRILVLNYGFVMDSRHFTLEMLGNLGVRFKERTFEGRNDESEYSNDILDGFGVTHTYNYKGWFPHLGLGVRLGWKLIPSGR